MEELLAVLPRALLEVSVLLAGAVLIGLATQRVNLPLTVVLAVAGMAVTASGADLAMADLLRDQGFEELLVNLFLPILIFEAALTLPTREFMRSLPAIVLLATVALLISAALVAVGLSFALGLPAVVALLFGVLISATDPVAVVAIFRELGVPERLLTLVEGESMLNDGVAIVLYEVFLVIAIGGSITLLEGVGDFLAVVLGGAAIGGVIGVAAVLLLPRLPRLPAVTLSLAVAYGSFLLADAVLGFSGVMATVVAGLLLGGMLTSRADTVVRSLLHELWDALGFVANALLFLLIGLALDPDLLLAELPAIGLAIGAVLLARPLAIVPLMSLLNRLTGISTAGRRNEAVLVWGGLRGGVALALALALPVQLAERDLLIAMTGGVVLATLLFNATTIKWLVHLLRLAEPSDSDRYLGGVARLVAVRSARERLTDLGLDDELVHAHLDVAEADARDRLQRAGLDADRELDVLILRGLHIEQQTYERLAEAGLLPPIAVRTLLFELEDEIEEVEHGALRVDAARRAALPWYGRIHRRLLGLLPEPLGEDLTEVAYIEVSARRLAARRAAEELEMFKELPHVDHAVVDRATAVFAHWERSCEASLDDLDQRHEGVVLRRREAKALSRLAALERLSGLVEAGVIEASASEEAIWRVAREVEQASDG